MEDQNYLEIPGKEDKITMKIIKEFDEKYLQDILKLEKECPGGLQYPDAENIMRTC
jgi:hypothetical protein